MLRLRPQELDAAGTSACATESSGLNWGPLRGYQDLRSVPRRKDVGVAAGEFHRVVAQLHTHLGPAGDHRDGIEESHVRLYRVDRVKAKVTGCDRPHQALLRDYCAIKRLPV